MSESKSTADSWWSEWLEQQRLALNQMAANGAGSQSAENSWLKLVEFYTQAPKGAAAEGSGDSTKQFAPFALGEELIEIWRRGWAAADVTRKAAESSLSDLIGRLPPLGIAREQTQLWRELATAQNECHALEQELRAVLLKVHTEALAMMEQRLRGDAHAADEMKSLRDLYNLWVRCAEEIYSQLAHSEAFCKLQADLGNATLRLRTRQQKIIEQVLKQFDLPTRAEINSVHLQLRQMRERIAQLECAAAVTTSSAAESESVRAKRRSKGTSRRSVNRAERE
jgi:hypothetical protein